MELVQFISCEIHLLMHFNIFSIRNNPFSSQFQNRCDMRNDNLHIYVKANNTTFHWIFHLISSISPRQIHAHTCELLQYHRSSNMVSFLLTPLAGSVWPHSPEAWRIKVIYTENVCHFHWWLLIALDESPLRLRPASSPLWVRVSAWPSVTTCRPLVTSAKIRMIS